MVVLYIKLITVSIFRNY